MAEWLKAPVLKTGDAKAFGGSNPSPSAKLDMCYERARGERFAVEVHAFVLMGNHYDSSNPRGECEPGDAVAQCKLQCLVECQASARGARISRSFPLDTH